MKDFYYILGVDANCSFIEIKEAYRKLSKKFHPDLNQNDKYFEGRFREIHEAYIILNDPTQRAIYDSNLKKLKSPPSSGSSYSKQAAPKPPSTTYYQARPAASYRVNPRRSIDVLFTIILIGVTVVFGDYVYKALHSSKINKTYSAPVVNAVSYPVPVRAKHHHRRHGLKIKPVHIAQKVSSANVTATPPIQPVVAAIPKPAVAVLPAPVIIKPVAPAPDYLYKSTIHSNLTGIVNMRESAKYSSAVVKQIPGDSEVDVLEKGGAYYKVRFKGVEGFVPKWAVVVK